jgi:hypothetical protein
MKMFWGVFLETKRFCYLRLKGICWIYRRWRMWRIWIIRWWIFIKIAQKIVWFKKFRWTILCSTNLVRKKKDIFSSFCSSSPAKFYILIIMNLHVDCGIIISSTHFKSTCKYKKIILQIKLSYLMSFFIFQT